MAYIQYDCISIGRMWYSRTVLVVLYNYTGTLVGIFE